MINVAEEDCDFLETKKTLVLELITFLESKNSDYMNELLKIKNMKEKIIEAKINMTIIYNIPDHLINLEELNKIDIVVMYYNIDRIKLEGLGFLL